MKKLLILLIVVFTTVYVNAQTPSCGSTIGTSPVVAYPLKTWMKFSIWDTTHLCGASGHTFSAELDSIATWIIANYGSGVSGTVTSVGLTGGNGITIGGTSPITTSGTFTAKVDTSHNNNHPITQKFAQSKIDSVAALISNVTPAALTKTNDTNITLTLGGTPATALLQATSLTLGWTGTLADGRITSASTWNAKQNAITTGSTSQYLRGDLSLATFPTNVSTFINDAGYLTSPGTPSLTSTQVGYGIGGLLGSSSGLTYDLTQGLFVTTTSANVPVLSLKQGSGMTSGNIFEVKDNSNTQLFAIDRNGKTIVNTLSGGLVYTTGNGMLRDTSITIPSVTGYVQFSDSNTTKGYVTPSRLIDSSAAKLDTSFKHKFWGIAGNAGTNTATNFIGTTDAHSFAIVTNDSIRALIDSFGNFNGGAPSTNTVIGTFGVPNFGWGFNVNSTGLASTAFGEATIASGRFSFAFGHGGQAIGDGSTCFGDACAALGKGSFCGGHGCMASGFSSFSFGRKDTAIGRCSVAMGDSGVMTTDYEFAWCGNILSIMDTTTTHKFVTRWNYANNQFELYSATNNNISFGDTTNTNLKISHLGVATLSGNGSVNLNTAGINAVHIDNSQNVGIGTVTPATTLDVNGDVTIETLSGGGTQSIGVDNTGKVIAVVALANVASTYLIGQSAANSSITTFTPGANGSYSVGGNVNVTALTSGSITMQVTYTNETSGSITKTFVMQGLTSGILTGTGDSNFSDMTIRAKASTAITVITTTSLPVGLSYNVGAHIISLGY